MRRLWRPPAPGNHCKSASSDHQADPLLTCDSAQTTRNRDLQVFPSPLTDSNRRPPPYHEREEGVDSCGIPRNAACPRASAVAASCRVSRLRATWVRPAVGRSTDRTLTHLATPGRRGAE